MTFETVTLEQLEAVAGTPSREIPQMRNGYHGNGSFDIDAWLSRSGLELRGPEQYQGGRKWILPVCPWNDSHTGGSAFVIQRANGVLQAGCHHNGCSGHDWHSLRGLYDRGHQERRNGSANGHQQHDESEAPFDDEQSSAEPEPAKQPDSTRIEYQRFTCAELDSGDFTHDFLIDNILVANEPHITCGPRKGLKTSFMVDAAISLATATPLLGKFNVNRAVRVGMMSGESGMGTLQKTARAVAAAKGFNLADIGGLIWSPDLPKFGNLLHMDALEKFMRDDELEALGIDPAYLAIQTGGDEGSLFRMGELLRSVSELCQHNGVTMLLAHHFTKAASRDFEPPDLGSISWSGFSEFARQWWLLNRRSQYVPGSGLHSLWFSAGGSAGHGGLWGVNVDEGLFPDRQWRVEVLPPDELREQASACKKQSRDKEHRGEVDDAKRDLVYALRKYPAGETKTVIRDLVNLRSNVANDAISELLKEGVIVPVEVVKSNRNKPYEGYKVVPETNEL